MPIDNKVLQDYVATANSGKYNSWEEINSKFPELKEYDSKALQDYVATANSGKYKDWNELNSKFPELFGTVKKKETTESSSAGGSSAMQGQENQEPSEFYTYKARPDAAYKKVGEKWFIDPNNSGQFQEITAANRIAELNKNAVKKGSVIENQLGVNPLEKAISQKKEQENEFVFKGYPGKEKNEYRIVDNTWQRRQPGEDDWTNVVNQGSVDALNKHFKQDVKVSKYRSAVIDEVEIKKKEEAKVLDTKLAAVGDNIATLTEEDVVPKLSKLFPEFKFEETGIGNTVIITAPKGVDKVTVPLNTNDTAPNETIKNFLETYSNTELVNELSKTKKLEEKRSEALSYKSADDYLRNKDKRDNEAFLTGFELQKQKEQLVEEYNNAFIEIKTSKDYSPQKLASLPKNNYVKRAIETSNDILNGKLEDFNKSLKEIEDLKVSGVDEDTLNAKIEEVRQKQVELKKDVAKSNLATRALGEAEINNKLIRESQGSTAGGMVKSFAEGLISIDRMFGVSAEENTKFLEDIIGLTTTKEYSESQDRGAVYKAMSSVFNSFGVVAPAMLTGGASGYISTGLFFNQSYHEMKDELDQVEGMDSSDKVLMSIIYGGISGALEKVGLGTMLNKSGIGNSIVKATMSRAIKDIPKDASREVVELAIERSAKSIAADIFAKAGTASLTEGATEALQYMSGEGVKELYDIAKGVDYFKHEDFGKQVWENFYLGALAGGITNTSWSAANRLAKEGANALKKGEIETLLNDVRNPELLELRRAQISESVKSGEITKERGIELNEYYDKAVNLISKLPEDLSAVQSKKALDLMIERDGLSEAIKGKDENLVASTKERINEINNQLKVLGENAVQEQTTNESVLRNEESKVGLPEVEQGNKEQEVVAEEGKQKEDVVIPQEELDALTEFNQEVERKQDEGSIDINLGETAYMGDTQGTIKIDPQNENTVVFETEDKIIELGNVNEIAESDIASFGLSLSPETKADVDQSGIVTYEGKKYKVIGRRRDKKGQSVVRVKDVDSGLERRIIGPDAENILKDQALAKKKQEPQLRLTTEGKEVVVDKQKVKDERRAEKLKAKQEFEAKSLQEIEKAQQQAEKDIADFEEMALKEISKKPKTKDLVQVGDKVFQVTKKADGTFTVSQMREDGKLVGIKDEKSKDKAVKQFEKERTSEEKAKLKEAQRLVDEFRKTEEDKILSLLDKAIEATSQKNRAFDATLGIPVFVANTSLKIVRAAYVSGKTLAEAVKDGYNYVVKNGYKGTEYEYNKYVSENINQQTQDKQIPSPSAKKILGIKGKKVTVDEMTALKDQIKVTKKVAEEIAKNIKENKANAKALFVERMKGIKAKISKTQYDYTLRKAMKTDFSNPESVEIFNAYVDKVISKAENAQKIDDAYALRKKVAKLSKSKAWHIVSTAKQFAKIDPVMVEDLDMYMALANEIYNSKKPSRVTKEGSDLAQAADLDKINKYAEKEIARQEEIKKKSFMYADKNALLVEKGILKESMTYAEMIEAVKNLDDSAALTKEQKQEHYEGVRDLVRELQDEVKSREDVPSEIKEIAKYNPRDLSNKNIVEMYEILDNYLMNGIVDKSSMFIEKLKGVDNGKLAERAGVKFKPVKIMPRISMAYMNFLSSLPLIEERLLGSTLKAERFRRVSGFSEFESNVVRSIRLHEGILKRYDAKFRKIKDFNTAENIYQRGAIAYLLRNMDTEFDKRKKNLLSSIEEMKKSRRSDLVKKAEVYEKIFEDIGLKDAKSFDELNVNKNNLEAVKFWQNEWSGLYDQLSNVASTIHNKILKRDTNYSPDFYKKTKKYETYEEQFLDGKHFQDLGSVKTDMAGVLMDANPPSSLLNKYVDLDFDTNNVEEIQSALLSINTDADVIRLKSFLNSKEFDNLFEDGDLAEIMRNRYTDYINRSTNRTSTEPRLLGITNLNVISTAMALGSVFQVVKNTLPIIASTSVNVLAGRGLARRKIKMDLFLGADKRDFLDRIDYDISMRGQEAATGIRQKLHYEAADKNKLVKLLVRGSEEILKQTTGRTDKFVARAAWMSYYESELKNKGVDIKSIDWSTHKVDDKAASYAQSMVNRQQNPSNTNLAPTAQRSAFGEALNIIQPFSPFIMNTKFRIRADFATMTSRRGDMTREERIKARASIVSSIAEIATFRAIQISIYAGTVALVNAINGDSPDDEKEEISFVDKLLNGMVSQAILDSFSPLPVLDGVTAMGVNKVFELTNRMIQTEDNIAEFIHDKELEKLRKGDTDPFTASELDKLRDQYFKEHTFEVDYYRKSDKLGQELSTFGKLGIPAEKLITTIKDIVEVKAQGKWKDDYGNIKYIPIEASGMANQMVAYDLLSLSPDMATMARRTRKYINKMSLSGSQYDKYVEVKSQVGDLFTIDDIYLLKATNMKVEDIVSMIFTYSNSKDRLATYKKLKEAEIIK